MAPNVQNQLPQLTSKKLGRAREFAKKGRTVAALQQYEEIIKFDPCDGYVWLDYADALTDLFRFKEAFDAYQKALDFAPDNKKRFVFARIGILLEQSNGIGEAETYYRLAIDGLEKDVPWVQILCGKNLLMQGKYEEAESLLADAAGLVSTERGEAYLNLAILYRATERYADCKKMVMEILAVDPSSNEAKEILETLKFVD